MADPRVEVIRRLARRGAWPALKRTLEKSRAEDIAVALNHLAPGQQQKLLAQLNNDEKTADVLTRLDDEVMQRVLTEIPFERLVKLLHLMEVDDEAYAISLLPEEVREKVLNAMKGEEKTQLEELLAWPEESAGSLMHPAAFRLNEDQTCRDAITALQGAADLEMVFYLYVENEAGQLVGVASLRGLLTHPPSTQLRDIMATDVITVAPETDQEDLARLASRYDLLAIPVVDPDRRMLGIITIDDIVDVIKDEAAEDMMLMAGVGDDLEPHAGSIFRSYRQRFPWLMITLCSGIGISEIINLFEHSLEAQAMLIGFIPVMMGTGGNVGTQAATITVRNIATGHVGSMGTLPMLFREIRVGGLLGLSFALVLGGYALARWWEMPLLGATIAICLVSIVIAAALVGMLVPLTLNKLGIDPAVATGPFVTTSIDLTAILIYFSISSAILL